MTLPPESDLANLETEELLRTNSLSAELLELRQKADADNEQFASAKERIHAELQDMKHRKTERTEQDRAQIQSASASEYARNNGCW